MSTHRFYRIFSASTSGVGAGGRRAGSHAVGGTGAGGRRAGSRRIGWTAAGVLGLVAAAFASTAPPAAAATGHLGRPRIVGVYGTTTVDDVSCSPSQYCLVGGQARDATGDYGFVATINDGTVGSLVNVSGMNSVAAVACPQKGWCLAFGFGKVVNSEQPDLLAAIVNGKPVKAAVEMGTNLPITGIACESADACFVVGSINGRGLVVPVIDGRTTSPKEYASGQLLNAISCPASLNTCVVMGSNPSSSKHRTAYVVRITGAQPSAVATAIGGISDPTGMACTAYYSCLVSGIDTTTNQGEVEDVSHTTAGDIHEVNEPFVYETTCASTTLCATIALTAHGVLGIVPVTGGQPGAFTAAMPGPGDQTLTGIACQGSAHCYAVGSDVINRRLEGVVFRFAL
jgi:hypothetical protein